MPAISITALSDPVAIVHIPVNLTADHSTKLYWTINRATNESAEFFNVTSNQIEIAIFAPIGLVVDEWCQDDPDVRVDAGWRVFEISSGDEGDTANYDSPHLRCVSAPLARAGISILYQSSYFTDFLLVKEEDFERAATIFTSQGWHVNETDPLPTPSRRRSGFHSPLSTPPPRTCASPSPPPTPIPTAPEITVLSAPLACVGFAKSAERACNERIRKYVVWPERSLIDWAYEQQQRRSASASVSEVEVEMEVGAVVQRGRPFISYTRTEDGTSLVTEVKALRGMFPEGDMEELDVQCAGELSCDEGEDEEDDEEDSDDEEDQEDDEEGRDFPMLSPPTMDLNIGMDQSMGHGMDMPPTPPLTASSTASSPEKKRLSLPLSPSSDLSVPFSWTRRTTRSMSHRQSHSHSNSLSSALPQSQSQLPRATAPRVKERNPNGTKRCLQLDLRGVVEGQAYHLDKFGLVTLFSDLLTSAQIKMLYSSTFHTANILVEGDDIARARRLLKRGKM